MEQERPEGLPQYEGRKELNPMALLDKYMTDEQKKYVRFAYEMAVSIMLVVALQMYNVAYAEGSADCRISLHKQGEFYNFYDLNYTSIPPELQNISVREIGSDKVVPVVFVIPNNTFDPEKF